MPAWLSPCHRSSSPEGRRRHQETRGLSTKYRASKTVRLEIDGERRTVQAGDLLRANDPLLPLVDAEPVQVEA
jgi:hypothetical protein